MEIKIVLPREVEKKLLLALEKAGLVEIGGILMGEHLADAEFQIVDLTVQKQYGRSTSFIRFVREATAALVHFFRQFGNDYTRFNYLGEWHSHPLFSPIPSQKDIQSMLEIVNDRGVGANFAILLVVRLDDGQNLAMTATAFLPNYGHFRCELIREGIT